jgi:hypothetical protein
MDLPEVRPRFRPRWNSISYACLELSPAVAWTFPVSRHAMLPHDVWPSEESRGPVGSCDSHEADGGGGCTLADSWRVNKEYRPRVSPHETDSRHEFVPYSPSPGAAMDERHLLSGARRRL